MTKQYSQWISEFLVGKREVSVADPGEKTDVHSVRRFIDTSETIWETAITYTGRLVVRRGKIGANGTSMEWENWVTEHDVGIW